jgi:hypothetical protein
MLVLLQSLAPAFVVRALVVYCVDSRVVERLCTLICVSVCDTTRTSHVSETTVNGTVCYPA